MAKKPYPSEIADRFQVRMPDGLRDRIAAAADANNRSMNSEIVARLEASFSPPLGLLNQPPDPYSAELLSAGAKLMARLVNLPSDEFRAVMNLLLTEKDADT